MTDWPWHEALCTLEVFPLLDTLKSIRRKKQHQVLEEGFPRSWLDSGIHCWGSKLLRDSEGQIVFISVCMSLKKKGCEMLVSSRAWAAPQDSAEKCLSGWTQQSINSKVQKPKQL